MPTLCIFDQSPEQSESFGSGDLTLDPPSMTCNFTRDCQQYFHCQNIQVWDFGKNNIYPIVIIMSGC